jgi:hypothetical protein
LGENFPIVKHGALKNKTFTSKSKRRETLGRIERIEYNPIQNTQKAPSFSSLHLNTNETDLYPENLIAPLL